MRALLAVLLMSAPAWCREKPIYVDLDSERPKNEPLPATSLKQDIHNLLARIRSGELPKIQFDFDKATIRLESQITLDAVADLLLRNPDVKLMVIAHTCALGTDQYNMDLSRRRAKSVRQYIVEKGVWPTSVRYLGVGYHQPIADNSTEEGREKNRRVEFRFTYRDWDSVF